MKKAVIYTCHLEGRISEPNNEMQRMMCKEYAQQKEIEIVGNYSDYVATKREPLLMKQRLLQDSKQKQWDVVLFSSMTILGRNLNEIMRFLSALSKYVEYKFIDQENNEVLKTIGELLKDMYRKKHL